ncbi:phage holin family protein [Soonwooa sp.]|uniref:phage holin family protein n=1 Tax=Soonwooa sp. TaxID=1938592 RepID=UPI0026294B4A|nr:phage holin family protein [Soonwooa sp.]
MRLIINLLVTAVSAFLLSKILSGVHFQDFGSAIIFAIVLGILNMLVRPILAILSLPITILTLGLFSLVINAVMILLCDHFMDSMTVDGFGWAFVFSILLSIVSAIIGSLFTKD